MKALTVRQPWASLIAAGVKTIETRPRPTRYRGRVAIHAARSEAWRQGQRFGRWAAYRTDRNRPARMYEDGNPGAYGPDGIRLPLGAVVASAVLTDCVPIVQDGWPANEPWRPALVVEGDTLTLYRTDDPDEWTYGDDQRPYGDFSPGRWALLLNDIAPTTERCPACWGAQVTGETVWHQSSREGGVWLDTICSACEGMGTCDPVPARGQQAVPWEWTP